MQSTMIELPLATYRHLEQIAVRQHRTISEAVVALVAQMGHEPWADEQEGPLSIELERELNHLEQFSDSELRSVWAVRPLPTDETTMQTLLDKQHHTALTPEEQLIIETLSRTFNRLMLLRAKAALLLKQRGYDVLKLNCLELI